MKINILTSGRYHVCDLARELDRQGFDVRFYSYVPTKRLGKFGLRQECCKPLFGIMAPFLFLERLIKCNITQKLKRYALDYIAGFVMRDCDFCIAMSGSFVYAIKKAKRRGSIVILERGSKHVLAQKRILDALPKSRKISSYIISRELQGYEMADYISVASQHVKRSFEENGVQSSKIFVNPYGVDLSHFFMIKETKKKYDLIMVGNWSFQKGCDIIVEAVREMNLKLLHVGAIYDLPFPEDDFFLHIEPVDQKDLVLYYNLAKIFLLPSRQEGLALVQLQAVACNLPLIGSKDSGAEDIKEMVDNPEYIYIIDDYNKDSVKRAVINLLSIYSSLGDKSYAGKGINKITWEAYGTRYTDFLNNIS